jgi:hypothetical protein
MAIDHKRPNLDLSNSRIKKFKKLPRYKEGIEIIFSANNKTKKIENFKKCQNIESVVNNGISFPSLLYLWIYH